MMRRFGWLLVWVAGITVGCGGGGVVVLDSTPPVIHALVVTPDALIAPGMVLHVQVTATDDRLVQQVEAQVTYPDGTRQRYALLPGEGGGYGLDFVAQWDLSRATSTFIQLQVVVLDSAGNRAMMEKTLTTPLPPPGSPF